MLKTLNSHLYTKPNLDQELDICNRVYEIATYNMKRVGVAIKKYKVNKSSYIQIRLYTAKDAENLGLVRVYEAKPGKESTMDQQLDMTYLIEYMK